MSWVIAKPGENIESLLRRFKKAVENSGILVDFKGHEFYEKPSVKRKRKQAAARKRTLKKERKLGGQEEGKKSNQNFKWNKDRTKKIPLPPPKKYTLRGQSNDRNSSSTRNRDTRSTPNRNSSDKDYNKSKNPRSTPDRNVSNPHGSKRDYSNKSYAKRNDKS